MDIRIRDTNKAIENIIKISSLLYIIDIFIISQLNLNLNIRVQDIASLLSIFSLPYIIKRHRNTTKNFSYIVLYINIFLTYIMISSMLFYIKGNINEMFVFYIGKEIEFILCMITISYFSQNYNDNFYRILCILIITNIIYGFYQIFTGKTSYYGIGTIFEEAPSISGMIYFICSVVSFVMYKKFAIKRFKGYSLLTYVLTIFTISKTSILGLTIFYILFFILEKLYNINIIIKGEKQDKRLISFRKILLTFIILILICILAIIFLNVSITINILRNEWIQKIVYRFNLFNSSYSFRKNKARFYYDYFIGDSILSLFFGCGKGITEFAFDVNTLGVDNQFVRGIIELGLVGIII